MSGDTFNKTLLTPFSGLLVLTLLFSSGSGATELTSTGGTRLEIFSGQQPPAAPGDTLSFQRAYKSSDSGMTKPVPERFRLYDLDIDGVISEWEVKEVIKDFQENDSPYSEPEVYSFIDYFFSEN